MLMSRRFRSTSLFVVLATALALMGLTAPGAQAEDGDFQVSIVNQPTDAGVGDLITAKRSTRRAVRAGSSKCT